MVKKVIGIVFLVLSGLIFLPIITVIAFGDGDIEVVGMVVLLIPAVIFLLLGLYFILKKPKLSESEPIILNRKNTASQNQEEQRAAFVQEEKAKLKEEKAKLKVERIKQDQDRRAKLKEEKNEQKVRKRRTLYATHVTGLPLGNGSKIELVFANEGLEIFGGGNTFSLPYSRVSAVEVKTNKEIQKAYVSSVGGAVGGAVLFGPLGAMIGGRAKEKASITLEYYLIVTYNKDENIEHLSFQLPNPRKAFVLIDHFYPRFTGARQVAL